MYFDTAYVAKCYLNETEAKLVRSLAARSSGLYSSAWCIPELACALQRHIRESHLTSAEAARIRSFFLADIHDGAWSLLPLSERFLFRATAQSAGFTEIWSNDRRLLEAAPVFGLTGRSV
jgi:predicted nucleic acid-binding protein